MKKLFLAVALIAATFSAAFAGNGISKAENDAAMKAGRKILVAKTSELEASIKRHDNAAAEAAAMDILALMRKGVGQTRTDSDLMTGAGRDARYKHMLGMETIVHDYIELARDVDANNQKLLQTAKTFLTTY